MVLSQKFKFCTQKSGKNRNVNREFAKKLNDAKKN